MRDRVRLSRRGSERGAALHVVQATDVPRIAGFLEAHAPVRENAALWERRLRHWWDENPAFGAETERGWLLERDGAVVGFLGSIPRLLEAPEGTVTAAAATTWCVLPGERARSLALLARSVEQRAWAHLNTTASEAVAQLLPRFGFEPFPGAERTGESVLALAHGPLVAAVLGRRLPRRAARGAAAILAPLSRARAAWSERGLARAATLPAAVLDSPDARIDALGAGVHRGSVTAHRSARVLRWFLEGSGPEPRVLIGCSSGPELVGTILLARRAHSALPVLECLDLVRADDDPAIVASLVLAAGAFAREKRMAAVAFGHFDPLLARTLPALGLVSRSGLPRNELAHLFSGEPLARREVYLTHFEGDRGLA